MCECERQSAGGATHSADNELLHLTDGRTEGRTDGRAPSCCHAAAAATAAAAAGDAAVHDNV